MGVCDCGEMAASVCICISRDWFVGVEKEMTVLVCVCSEVGVWTGRVRWGLWRVSRICMWIDWAVCLDGKTNVCVCGGDNQGCECRGREWSLNVEEKLWGVCL